MSRAGALVMLQSHASFATLSAPLEPWLPASSKSLLLAGVHRMTWNGMAWHGGSPGRRWLPRGAGGGVASDQWPAVRLPLTHFVEERGRDVVISLQVLK